MVTRQLATETLRLKIRKQLLVMPLLKKRKAKYQNKTREMTMKRMALGWIKPFNHHGQKNHGVQEFRSGKRSARSGDLEFRNTSNSPQGRKRREMTAKLATRLKSMIL